MPSLWADGYSEDVSPELKTNSLEVVAKTAHGTVEVRHCSGPDYDLWLVCHALHGGRVCWVWGGGPAWRNRQLAHEAGLNFYEQWKKEFALEYLAYRLEP